MKNIAGRLVLFIMSLLVWILFTFSFDIQHLAIGLACSMLVSLLVGDIFTQNPQKFKDIQRYFWFLYYIPIFVWEMIKANIDVAYRVIHPGLPIKPGIVKVKTNLKSETGLTFLANSITLTPGTMSVDIDKENGYLYIHWINVKSEDVEQASKIIVDRFEKILMKVFE